MIGSDVVGPTAISATKTQLGGADIVLPSWARAILAVRPWIIDKEPTADEEILATMTLESDDFSVQPFTVLANPILPHLGITIAPYQGEPPWYPVNCPINGGDRLKAFGITLDTTTATYMGCQVIMSDKKPGSQKHAKVGSLTVSGAAGIATAEAAYTVTGGSTLEELYGMVTPTAIVVDDGMIGHFDFKSNDLKMPTPLKLPTNPINGILGAVGGPSTPGLSRTKVEVPILSPCQFTNFLTLLTVPGAGAFITGVLYT